MTPVEHPEQNQGPSYQLDPNSYTALRLVRPICTLHYFKIPALTEGSSNMPQQSIFTLQAVAASLDLFQKAG